MKTLYSLMLCTLIAAPAFAVDGVVLTNQSIALAGGVTPGDTPGFPVTISVPGSYRLSGNLVVPDQNTTAILVTANFVTIDLNGFSILGPTTCSLSPLGSVASCSPTGAGIGIEDQTNATNTTVTNGSIVGMGNFAISLGTGGKVDKVTAQNCGGVGISVLDSVGATVGILNSGLISNSTAANNGSHGFTVNGTIINSSAYSNFRAGIVGSGVVTGNNANNNGTVGIGGDCPFTTIIGNTAVNNAAGNILQIGSGCVEINNMGQ